MSQNVDLLSHSDLSHLLNDSWHIVNALICPSPVPPFFQSPFTVTVVGIAVLCASGAVDPDVVASLSQPYLCSVSQPVPSQSTVGAVECPVQEQNWILHLILAIGQIICFAHQSENGKVPAIVCLNFMRLPVEWLIFQKLLKLRIILLVVI